MGELWFAIKSFVVALFFLWVMQFRIGEVTLEEKATDWIESSRASNQIREMAAAAVQVAHQGVEQIYMWLAGEHEARPEKRSSRSGRH
ncbi:MAG: hypothetical protein C5B49_10085 [Bdellovibrio sp.]|nr:MAG: hypothetical protein C5B49_10085 [Bdellovibrio sp.]